MKIFSRYPRVLAALCLIGSWIGAMAADSNPEFYLRGELTDPAWTKLEYKFISEGNDYSIHVDHLNGLFKISNADWTINFGAKSKDVADTNIDSSTFRRGVSNGENFYADNLESVDISFTYNEDSNTAQIKFVVDGVEPIVDYGTSGTLPVLYINVYDENGDLNDEIISKDLGHKNYFTGEYWLDLNGCEWLAEEGAKSVGSKEEPLPLQIKARGNYTRIAYSKKPFKLKLDKKQSLLGMSKSKHYAILAHSDDRFGYMRNFAGFNLGKRIGLPWTPSQQPVEVVINGDYRGLYFLTESIRIESDRVNIEELADNETDASLASGGYLVELDNYDEDNQIRLVEKGQYPVTKDALRITFDTPEEYSEIQRKFVTHQFTAMNDAIGDNSDELWSYMDLDDAARYYIVEEIISHTEAFHGSTYLFRDRGEGQKWHFSPLWDCGNAFMGPSDDYFFNHGPFGNTWIPSMTLNATFMAKVKDTWKWFMSEKYDGIYEDLEEYADHIVAAAKTDAERWRNAPIPYGGIPVVDNSDMAEKLATVTNKLIDKTNWLYIEWGRAQGSVSEPNRDTTPAAPLPSFIISGIEDIESGVNNSNIEIYNLQGIKVTHLERGNIYIIHDGKTATKILAK